MRPGRRAAVVGALLGAAALVPASPAAAGDDIHRDGASGVAVTMRAPIGATFDCTVDYWSTLDFTTSEFRSWIEVVDGPTECFFSDAVVTVDYLADDGTQRSATASGRGGYASLSVPDVADPYPSRSYRAEHSFELSACDCHFNAATSPK